MTTMGARRAGCVAVIVALAAIGVGGERWASAGDEGGGAVPLAESTPSVIVPLAPARILDTRTGVGAPQGRVAPGSTLTLQVTGAGGVPAEATGVVLNLTATVADGSGYVTAYPAGQQQPNASVINYSAGEDVANMVTAQLGAGGGLAIFNDQANVHLVADVAGYLVAGSGAPGPQGPQGPAGPAGPGANEFDATFAPNANFTLASTGGVEIRGWCSATNGSIDLRTAGNTLRVAGEWVTNAGGSLAETNSGSSLGITGPGSVHFSGLVRDKSVGESFQLEIHVTPGAQCQGWGSAIPLG